MPNPLSWAHATTNQLFACRAIRSSCQMQTKLPASLSNARAAQYQVRWSSELHEEKTASKLGRTM